MKMCVVVDTDTDTVWQMERAIAMWCEGGRWQATGQRAAPNNFPCKYVGDVFVCVCAQMSSRPPRNTRKNMTNSQLERCLCISSNYAHAIHRSRFRSLSPLSPLCTSTNRLRRLPLHRQALCTSHTAAYACSKVYLVTPRHATHSPLSFTISSIEFALHSKQNCFMQKMCSSDRAEYALSFERTRDAHINTHVCVLKCSVVVVVEWSGKTKRKNNNNKCKQQYSWLKN